MKPPSTCALAVAAAFFAGAAGCSTELPDPPAGRSIRGRITYRGQAHRAFERPVLQVAALALVPPPGLPHGALFVDRPDFSVPVPYEMNNLPPWKYKVVARVFDVAHPTIEDAKLPTGGFPDFCTFATAPENNVHVVHDIPTAGIDITLYDEGGSADPCNRGEDVCPKPGAATLEVVLELARARADVKMPDQVVFAILTDPMQQLPTRFRILPASALAKGFPHTIVINDVPPGSYLVYACYDVGGNNLMGCGPEDFSVVHGESARLALDAAKVTTLRMTLDKKTSEVAKVDEAAARGCR